MTIGHTTYASTGAHSEQASLPPTTIPHVVIVGGGFGGLQAAKALRKEPVQITLIDQNNYHLFQPMLYQVATAGLAPSDISTPIRFILRHQENTEVLMAHVTAVDVEKQLVLIDTNGQAIPYDYLVVATGATTNYFGHREWEALAPGLKSLNQSLDVRNEVLSAFEAAEREPDEEKRTALLTFVLVGGGPTGVELAGALAELTHKALAHDFRHIRPESTRIILVESEENIIPSFPASLARKATRKLKQFGVEVKTGVRVTHIDEMGVEVDGEHIQTQNIIWTAGVKASPAGQWLHAEVDREGRVKVEDDLSVPGHSNVFVIGDTALVVDHGRELPGLAPVAMQEGAYIAHRIREKIEHRHYYEPFHYIDRGMLATVGRSFGIVAIGPLRFTGLFAWVFWLLVHILFLIGFRNRFIVFFQYAWAYFTFQRGARIIYLERTMRKP
jgi:NADH dehydrogenase